ncbi:hypothetical protein ACQI4F_03760 [Mycolicibacterium vaccae]|uniref:hypothetical protein n=1 Tax=Mycolicibacterium vaccae TaxID=1810 RepID=UPI003CED99D8
MKTLRVLLSALLLLGLPLLAGPAHAQPEADPAELALPWPNLGIAPQMLLTAGTATDIAVPVPAGVSAVRVRGVLHAPVNINAGFVEVRDGDGRFVAALEIPVATATQAVTSFDIDVAAAAVRDASTKLSFIVRSTDRADQVCGPPQQLLISELSTLYVGAVPPPTTIADFFPPVLERVVVYAPIGATAAEQQAVLTLVSTLTRLYLPMPLTVRVENLPRGAVPPPAARLERAVVVEQGSAGLRVEFAGSSEAFLRIAGQGDELTTQVSLLDNQLQSLAQVPTARVDQAGSRHQSITDTVTFKDLGLQGRMDVLRSGTLNVGMDRAALGPRVDGARVRLLADHTPVSPGDSATVTIRSGDDVVYTAPLDRTGRLDATFEVPRTTLRQRVGLDLTVTFTPQQECGPFIAPLSFQIDPESTLTLQRGGPPLDGFGSVPSEFSPEFYVGLDGSGQNQLIHAARVVGRIAALTTSPLSPKIVDFRSAVDSQTGALLVANSASLEQTSLRPPLSGRGSAISADLPGMLRADVENGLGSIQAFADPARNRSVVLVTTTDAWTLVDPLFGYLDGLPDGWAQLSGDVLAAGEAGTPTQLTIGPGGTDAAAHHAAETPPFTVVAAIVASVAVVLAAGAAWLWRRRRAAVAREAPGSAHC